MIRSRHSIQVQAVFSLYDILTGRQAQAGSFRFWLPENGRLIQKEGGYYVLIGCRDTEIIIGIESPAYEKAQIVKKKGQEELAMERVWLSPGRAYPGLRQFPYVKGQAAPYAEILAVPVESKQGIRLLQDYAARSQETAFPIFDVGKNDLAGRMVAAVAIGRHDRTAAFAVIQRIERKSGLCHIKKPFDRDLGKADTYICPVFSGRADQDGSYSVRLPKEAAQAQNCFVYCDSGGKTEMRETKIITGE